MKLMSLLAPVVFVTALVPQSAAQTLAPPSTERETISSAADECVDGVVKDDGTLESGYGWVPSVVDGRYVQRFNVAEFPSRKIDQVCICWSRTADDDEVSFRVELYRDRGGRPARSPEVSAEAVAAAVPQFPQGGFFTVDVSDAEMVAPTNVFYLGVQWDPSRDQFFFICVDQTDATPVVDGWYVDDRADGWTSVLESDDPIFDDHHAMMIRAVGGEGSYQLIPTVGVWGIIILMAVIAGVGVAVLRTRGT
jgi:hypothetical protein